VNKTILKQRVDTAADRANTHTAMGFSRRNKIPRTSAYYAISEKAIRFQQHPDYSPNPDRAQKLISSSVSRHLSTRNISSKSMHANRQTNRQTNTGKNIYLLLCRR